MKEGDGAQQTSQAWGRLACGMLIAEAVSPFDGVLARIEWVPDLFWTALFNLMFVSFVMMYFVIWSRVDWDPEVGAFATFLVTVGSLFLLIGVAAYGIVDVLTRPTVSTGNKVGFVIGLIFLGPLGWFIYFPRALRHKPTRHCRRAARSAVEVGAR